MLIYSPMRNCILAAVLMSLCLTAGSQTVIEVMVNQPEKLEILVEGDMITQKDNSAYLGANFSIAGGQEPFQYEWFRNELLVGKDSVLKLLGFTRTDTWSLRITDANKCKSVLVVPKDISVPIGIDDEHFNSLISVYPVPARNRITIDPGEFTGPLDISLLDNNGILFLTRQITGVTTISINVPPGIYYMKVEDRNKVLGVRKVLVSKF